MSTDPDTEDGPRSTGSMMVATPPASLTAVDVVEALVVSVIVSGVIWNGLERFLPLSTAERQFVIVASIGVSAVLLLYLDGHRASGDVGLD